MSDIRAEVPGGKTLDLEKVAPRERILRSGDLKLAIDTSRLRLLSQDALVEQKPKLVERIIEKEKSVLDEAKLAGIMRKILAENQRKEKSSSDEMDKVLQALGLLSEKIENINKDGATPSSGYDIGINPEELAALSSKAVDKISEDVETANTKTRQKIKLKDTNLTDLADELG